MCQNNIKQSQTNYTYAILCVSTVSTEARFSRWFPKSKISLTENRFESTISWAPTDEWYTKIYEKQESSREECSCVWIHLNDSWHTVKSSTCCISISNNLEQVHYSSDSHRLGPFNTDIERLKQKLFENKEKFIFFDEQHVSRSATTVFTSCGWISSPISTTW